MKQYIDLGKKILTEGTWIENKRTGKKCLTIINHDLEYDVANEQFPILTTRKQYYRQAIGEMLCYLRGYTKLENFHKLGVKTWDANANAEWWLESEFNDKPGESVGVIYGAAGNIIPMVRRTKGGLWEFTNYYEQQYSYEYVYPLFEIIKKLKKGEDDRGLIWNFWRPEIFRYGCLRPCMFMHHFSLVGDTLYLNSTQRSCDWALGNPFNMMQCYFLLWVMAKMTGHKPGKAFHKLVNVHIYEDQYKVLLESKQLEREPFTSPKLICHKPITVESVFGFCENEEDNLHPSDFELEGYEHHPAISYPFSV